MGGQIVLLNDKNGAGKSTMLEAAAGLLPLEKGEIFHQGELILDASDYQNAPTAFGLTLQSDGCVGSQRLEEHILNALDLQVRLISLHGWSVTILHTAGTI